MRIAYVEDNPTNLALVERVAGMNRHAVVSYAEGEIAAEELLQERFDLILMDVELAGEMSGLQVVRNLRQAGLTTPIIAVTAYAMLGDRERCLEAGCNGYLPKPLPIAELLVLLAKYDAETKAQPESAAVAAPVNTPEPAVVPAAPPSPAVAATPPTPTPPVSPALPAAPPVDATPSAMPVSPAPAVAQVKPEPAKTPEPTADAPAGPAIPAAPGADTAPITTPVPPVPPTPASAVIPAAPALNAVPTSTPVQSVPPTPEVKPEPAVPTPTTVPTSTTPTPSTPEIKPEPATTSEPAANAKSGPDTPAQSPVNAPDQRTS